MDTLAEGPEGFYKGYVDEKLGEHTTGKAARVTRAWSCADYGNAGPNLRAVIQTRSQERSFASAGGLYI